VGVNRNAGVSGRRASRPKLPAPPTPAPPTPAPPAPPPPARTTPPETPPTDMTPTATSPPRPSPAPASHSPATRSGTPRPALTDKGPHQRPAAPPGDSRTAVGIGLYDQDALASRMGRHNGLTRTVKSAHNGVSRIRLATISAHGAAGCRHPQARAAAASADISELHMFEPGLGSAQAY
jgi:hypothetical protein